MTTLVKILAAFFISMAIQAQKTIDSGSIDIVVDGITSNEGSIIIGVFSDKDSFLKKPMYSKKVNATKGEPVVIHFDNIPKGTYAISLFHDKDGNNELNRRLGMIPTEPYGISNNAVSNFGPPQWNQAKFVVDGTRVRQNIQL